MKWLKNMFWGNYNMNNIIEECVQANKSLKENGLVKLTWGNVSCKIDDQKIVIKPSGVKFEELCQDDMSIVDINTGNLVTGLKPSVDTKMHLEIYRNMPQIKSVLHSHSKYATSWSQANKKIPLLGTTHADYFDGDIHVVPSIDVDDFSNYEKELGLSVVQYIKKNGIEPKCILLENHGVLVFTEDLNKTIECAIVLEEVAEIALHTLMIKPERELLRKDYTLFAKHYDRKNGKNKYYGQ